MAAFPAQLQNWIVENLSPLTDTHLKRIPDISKLSLLTEGKNRRIWKYIIDHVRNRSEVERVRRILKIKRSQCDVENAFPAPTVDVDKIRVDIARANEKKTFLQTSLEKEKAGISSVEVSLRQTDEEISKMYQKCALLEMLSEYYRDQTVYLESVLAQLSSHLGVGFSRPEPLTKSNGKASLISIDDIDIKQLLLQCKSAIAKKFDDNDMVPLLVANMINKIDKMTNTVLVTDLISNLKEQTKSSGIDVLAKETNPTVAPIDVKRLQSKHYLNCLKSRNVSTVFAIKKHLQKIASNSKQAHMELDKIKSSHKLFNSDFEGKCTLLEKLASSKGLEESVHYLKDVLTNLQNETKALTEENVTNEPISQHHEAVISKFYKQFDAVKSLQKMAPETFLSLIANFNSIHCYVNNEVFVGCTPVLRDYPLEINKHLASVFDTTWKVADRQDIVKPVLSLVLPEPDIPDGFYTLTDIQPFHNLVVFSHHLFHMKRNLPRTEQFVAKETTDFNTKNDQENILHRLQEMMKDLEKSESFLSEGVVAKKRVDVSLVEWWEQPAQDIPNIIYEGKTLKMWRDVLFLMSDF